MLQNREKNGSGNTKKKDSEKRQGWSNYAAHVTQSKSTGNTPSVCTDTSFVHFDAAPWATVVIEQVSALDSNRANVHLIFAHSSAHCPTDSTWARVSKSGSVRSGVIVEIPYEHFEHWMQEMMNGVVEAYCGTK